MDNLLPLLAIDFLGKPAWVWLVFIGVVFTLLAFDLGVLHKDDQEIGVRESLLLSAGYISVALIFGAWVWWLLGAQSGMACYTGFVIEKSLSMDNVFVIALIFTLLCDSTTVPAPGAVLGHPRRDRAARPDDRAGRHAG